MDYEKKLKNFLKKKSRKQKIIVIYGPTACGKTALSLEIAQALNTEIISADSRQIYKGMDIGTGKILPHEMQGIKHHMIDILPPNKIYSVGQYKKDVYSILEEIFSSGKIPILCGGTGLYIDSVIYDFDIPEVVENHELRKELENQAKQYGNDFVYKKLEEIDPLYAKEVHPNNLKYVIRGIEVKLLSGKSKKNSQKKKELGFETLFLTPYDGKRDILYENIEKRNIGMMRNRLVEEITNLLIKYPKESPAFDAIGYKEVIECLDGNITLEECLFLIQKNSRNYAKRQLTWFGKYEI